MDKGSWSFLTSKIGIISVCGILILPFKTIQSQEFSIFLHWGLFIVLEMSNRCAWKHNYLLGPLISCS